MLDPRPDPIIGKGAEMIPEKGNPFHDPGPVPQAYSPGQYVREILLTWEAERMADLAASEDAHAGRTPRELSPEEREQIAAHHEIGGLVGHLQTAETLPSASLPVVHEPAESNPIEIDQDTDGVAPETAPPERQPEPSLEDKPQTALTPAGQLLTSTSFEERIQAALQSIRESVGDLSVGQDLLDQAQEARSAANSGQDSHAERLLDELDLRMAMHLRLQQRASTICILIYEVAWLAVLITGLFALPRLILPDSFLQALASLLIGGIVGATAGLFSLWRRSGKISGLENTLHYFIFPLLGAPASGLVFLLFYAAVQLTVR